MAETAESGGLRERKKRQTRQNLLAAAESLFEARGYENVTVAEIADAANISVKTLFTYFRSKEDLAFGDADRLRDQILSAVRERGTGESPVDAVAALLDRLVAEGNARSGLEGFHTLVGESAALRSRLRRMWDDYEQDLSSVLVAELGPAAAARARLAASQIIAMVRSLTSPEVRALVGRQRSATKSRLELHAWVATAAAMVRDGVGDLAAEEDAPRWEVK
jgi:AcrR family transcriptional regulator